MRVTIKEFGEAHVGSSVLCVEYLEYPEISYSIYNKDLDEDILTIVEDIKDPGCKIIWKREQVSGATFKSYWILEFTDEKEGMLFALKGKTLERG
jgi:hypothetical protein